MLEKENDRIRRRIARMEEQYSANRLYISQLEKCLQLGTDTCYFLEFPERYVTCSAHSIDPALRGDYEMSIKEILCRQDSEETYLNSFFGGIFPRLSGTDHFETKF